MITAQNLQEVKLPLMSCAWEAQQQLAPHKDTPGPGPTLSQTTGRAAGHQPKATCWHGGDMGTHWVPTGSEPQHPEHKAQQCAHCEISTSFASLPVGSGNARLKSSQYVAQWSQCSVFGETMRADCLVHRISSLGHIPIFCYLYTLSLALFILSC